MAGQSNMEIGSETGKNTPPTVTVVPRIWLALFFHYAENLPFFKEERDYSLPGIAEINWR